MTSRIQDPEQIAMKSCRTERNWKPFVGVCAYHATVGDFSCEDESKWLSAICSTINEMFPEERKLAPAQRNAAVQAFRRTFHMLVDVFIDICLVAPEFDNLEIAFEYVIPTSDPDEDHVSARRADVVVFGEERAAILELKTGFSKARLEAKKALAIRQVNGYLREMNNWHLYATPDELRGCVVMFAEKEVFEYADYPMDGFEPATIVSKDKLDHFLFDCFDGHCTPVRNPGRWLRAFVSETNPYEGVFGGIADYAAEHFDEMPELDGDEKAAIRRRIARRLGLRSPIRLRPLVAALTNGKWQLRDAVVQLLENLPQDRLETLFEGFQNHG